MIQDQNVTNKDIDVYLAVDRERGRLTRFKEYAADS